jgi:hypothetical protein
MPTLKRATIKSYTAATHKASIQIAGSLAVWMDAVPVATNIPPAEVIAGRECGVILFTDDNPDDAAVVTIHGAVPAAAAAGHRIQDADNNTSADVETSANEDKFRVKIAATERLLMQTTSPYAKFTGDTQIGVAGDKHGIDGLPDNPGTGGTALTLYIPGGAVTNAGYLQGIAFQNSATRPSLGGGEYFTGVAAAAIVNINAGQTAGSVEALNFFNALSSGGSLTEMNGVTVYPVYGISYSGTVTDARGIKIKAPILSNSNSSVWSNVTGIDILNQGHARVVNAIALRIANITGATGNMYLAELLGATSTNLRVEAGDPTNPGANLGRSRCLMAFNENGTITLRRIEWKLNGADKMLVAI